MKKYLIIAILSTIVFGSCKKSEKENPQPVTKVATPPTTVIGPDDTIYVFLYRVNGFTDAGFVNLSTSTPLTIPGAKNIGSNNYDYSDGYEISGNQSLAGAGYLWYNIPLKRGDVCRFMGTTSLASGAENANFYDFEIFLMKYAMVDGVKTCLTTIPPKIQISTYRANVQYFITLGQY